MPEDGGITPAWEEDENGGQPELVEEFEAWLKEQVEERPDREVRQWAADHRGDWEVGGLGKELLNDACGFGVIPGKGWRESSPIPNPLDWAQDQIRKGFDGVADSFAKGANELLVQTTTAWTRIPSGDAVHENAMEQLEAWLTPATAFLAVIGLIVGLTRLAFRQRGEELASSFTGLLRVMLVGGAGIWLVMQMLTLGDDFSRWIINEAGSDALSTEAGALLMSTQMASGLLFLLALVAILTSLIQIVLLVVRGALVTVMAGAWTMSAALTVAGEQNSQMFRKYTGWLAAFVLYKPAAAICYAAGFSLLQSGDGGLSELLAIVQGLMLLGLAILALPAMIRLTVPAAAMAGGSTMGAIAGGAAVASGAVMLAGGAGAGASGVIGQGGGGSGSASPTGNSQPGGASGGGSGSAGSGSGGGPESGGSGGGQPGAGAVTAATGGDSSSAGGGSQPGGAATGQSGGGDGTTGGGAAASAGESGNGSPPSPGTATGAGSAGGPSSGTGENAPASSGAVTEPSGSDAAPAGGGESSSSTSASSPSSSGKGRRSPSGTGTAAATGAAAADRAAESMAEDGDQNV